MLGVLFQNLVRLAISQLLFGSVERDEETTMLVPSSLFSNITRGAIHPSTLIHQIQRSSGANSHHKRHNGSDNQVDV